jgi:hypothetical protein
LSYYGFAKEKLFGRKQEKEIAILSKVIILTNFA